MKTTIDLTDAMFFETKNLAKEQGTTLRALVEDGLRHVLARAQQAKTTPYVLPDCSVGTPGAATHADAPAPGQWREMNVEWTVARHLRVMASLDEAADPESATPVDTASAP